jgi:hypothetical protein
MLTAAADAISELVAIALAFIIGHALLTSVIPGASVFPLATPWSE